MGNKTKIIIFLVLVLLAAALLFIFKADEKETKSKLQKHKPAIDIKQQLNKRVELKKKVKSPGSDPEKLQLTELINKFNEYKGYEAKYKFCVDLGYKMIHHEHGGDILIVDEKAFKDFIASCLVINRSNFYRLEIVKRDPSLFDKYYPEPLKIKMRKVDRLMLDLYKALESDKEYFNKKKQQLILLTEVTLLRENFTFFDFRMFDQMMKTVVKHCELSVDPKIRDYRDEVFTRMKEIEDKRRDILQNSKSKAKEFIKSLVDEREYMKSLQRDLQVVLDLSRDEMFDCIREKK